MKIKKNKRLLRIVCWVLLITVLLLGIAISLEAATIMGTVKDGYLLTDNDQVYYIAEGEKGDEVTQLVGKKVKLAGKNCHSGTSAKF